MKSTYLHPWQCLAALVGTTGATAGPDHPRASRPTGRRYERAAGRSLLDRLDQWVWSSHQRDLEHSLASASDLADLERRLKASERTAFYRYY
jgi:hypothetical protein